MKDKLLFGLIVIAVVVGIMIVNKKPKEEKMLVTETPEVTESITPLPTSEESANVITIEELAMHSSREDCWLAIDGKVYDVTEFGQTNKHPGGNTLFDGCGKDATELFESRPMGSKTPHSAKARSFLPNFQIGVMASE